MVASFPMTPCSPAASVISTSLLRPIRVLTGTPLDQRARHRGRHSPTTMACYAVFPAAYGEKLPKLLPRRNYPGTKGDFSTHPFGPQSPGLLEVHSQGGRGVSMGPRSSACLAPKHGRRR
ncbi:hypothetical protein D9611_005349 [Ephemerocybe angulata]|uniref:Uncharacterized protein n=1 Tax=Ephemerocybe angulata TaxID=980116 RepID=A0A8H5C0L9_9AGAR|nr:hypothetical protein D9611_005349 [Tulosesus angulatus]